MGISAVGPSPRISLRIHCRTDQGTRLGRYARSHGVLVGTAECSPARLPESPECPDLCPVLLDGAARPVVLAVGGRAGPTPRFNVAAVLRLSAPRPKHSHASAWVVVPVSPGCHVVLRPNGSRRSRSAITASSLPPASRLPLKARPSSLLLALTSSRSAKSLPTSASCASPTPTRARASVTPAKSSAARSERLVSNHGHQH